MDREFVYIVVEGFSLQRLLFIVRMLYFGE